ncbi:MAG: helix-turn-helix domain-containing protein [Holosporaceae bacterium]|jgi:transcriptional regulator with XRE-family HTH domain|nr:helix-turn-helix domain-containing protein [Holosporaceae bacterium]
MEFNSALKRVIPIVYTEAQLKGRRLRMVRALTGFSRQELYEKIGIATSTIDTWESGRVELTEKGAIRVCTALRKVGINCTSEWLLSGLGDPPRMMGNLEKSFLQTQSTISIENEWKNAKDISFKLPPFLDEDIRKELSFFVNLHKDAIFHIVIEDFMNFRYKRGDCVAGKADDLKNLEGKTVIAQLNNEKTILCKLQHSDVEDTYVSYGKNMLNKSVKILKAAEIIWHRIPRKK